MADIIDLPKKEPKIENAAWSFELDPVNAYAYWNNAFSKIECESIINIAKIKV
jgi:hypothetical protein